MLHATFTDFRQFCKFVGKNYSNESFRLGEILTFVPVATSKNFFGVSKSSCHFESLSVVFLGRPVLWIAFLLIFKIQNIYLKSSNKPKVIIRFEKRITHNWVTYNDSKTTRLGKSRVQFDVAAIRILKFCLLWNCQSNNFTI